MEFKIADKAKKFTMALMIIGVVFTGLGIALYSGDHFVQKIITNGIIDTFFFFSIGLGALFFLALQYATETGWYAAVKRVIEGVAGFLPYGIALMILILGVTSLMKGAHVYTWMDPEVVIFPSRGLRAHRGALNLRKRQKQAEAAKNGETG